MPLDPDAQAAIRSAVDDARTAHERMQGPQPARHLDVTQPLTGPMYVPLSPRPELPKWLVLVLVGGAAALVVFLVLGLGAYLYFKSVRHV
jgi:hypothetical protein